MVTIAQACVASALAALLAVAGTIKIIRPGYAAGSIRRIAPKLRDADATALRRSARFVGGIEWFVGAALVVVPGPGSIAAAGAAVALFVTFAFVTRAAVKAGVACGCWGSLSDGPAGRGELARRVAFAAAATFVLAVRIATHESGIPLWIGGVVLGASAGAGAFIARGSSFPVASMVSIGAARELVASDGRRAGRRERRRILTALQSDPDVVKVVAELHATLDWDRARVRVNGRPAPKVGAKTLVSVPGTDLALRIVLTDGRTVAVIGESGDTIVVGADGTAKTIPKRGA